MTGASLRGLPEAAVVFGRLLTRPTPALTLADRLRMLPLADAPIARPVTIRWNAHAVPFLRAETDGDLAAALGIVHRHLRQAQLEVFRRLAAGRLAAMIGPAGLALDRSILSLGLDETVGAIAARLPVETRLWAERFVAGLNHHGRRAAPAPELAPLGIDRFEPWTLDDFFRLARLYSTDINWPVMARLLAVRDRLPPASWRRHWRTVLGAGIDAASDEAAPASPRGWLRHLAARGAPAGSNAAALAAARSASGGALLGGDPHLSIGLPNVWLLAGLASPTVEAVGLMLPGMPFVACGRNRDIAWGGTSLHAASSEFVSVPRPAARRGTPPGSDPSVRTVAVPVRFRRRPATLRLRRTEGGVPVVTGGALFPSRRPLGLRWIGRAPSDELTAMLGVLRARDAAGFRAALDGFAVPSQCMVYAGPDGIGRQVAAHLPARIRSRPEDLVRREADTAADWAAIRTGRDLFSEWNPPEGFVASANERLGTDAPHGHFFAADDRVSRLRALLAPAAGPFTFRRFAAVFLDERQPRALALRDRFAAVLPPTLPERRRAFADALRRWDGGYEAESRGALAFELLLAGVGRALLSPEERRAHAAIWATRALLSEAIGRAAPARLARAVGRAVPDAARRFRRFGTWGAVHRHAPAHPLGAVPLLGRRFRVPLFRGSGGNDTLNKTGHRPLRRRHRIRFGGTARYCFDLGDADRNEAVLFGGQDGWLGSANERDQLALWQAGRAVPMPFRLAAVRAACPWLTTVRPAPDAAAPPTGS